MTQKVSMPNFIHAVSKHYQLGECLCVKKLSGGLLHETWRLETASGLQVIKCLHPELIDGLDKKNRYRVTEKIAQQFSQVVPAVFAREVNGDVLFCHKAQTIMLFPYIDAQILPQSDIRIIHVEQIAHALANMHGLKMTCDNIPEVELLSCDLKKLSLSINLLSKKSAKMHKTLTKLYPLIENISIACEKYKNLLTGNTVVSHRDLDPKNVLWDKAGGCHIIDWESSGVINKTKDIMTTALYWTMDEKFKVDYNKLNVFINAYIKHTGIINPNEITAACYGLIADWIHWLIFNLNRINHNAEHEKEYLLGVNEVKKTAAALPIVVEQFALIEQTVSSSSENSV